MFMKYKSNEEKEYEAGDFLIPWAGSLGPKMRIKADTNEFEKEDVTVELFCGLYENEYAGENLQYSKASYQSYKEEPLVVALYICYPEGYKIKLEDIADYRNIEHHILLREWSEEEAFAGEFIYYAPNRSITYNHSEMLTIPAECFSEEKGQLSLGLVVFRYENSGLYNRVGGAVIELDYEITDEGKVLITNLEK